MYCKKTVISYLIWILYLMIAGTAAAFLGLVAATLLGMSNPLVALLFVAVFFGGLFLIYILTGVVTNSLHSKDGEKTFQKKKWAWAEPLFVTLFLAAGLVLRILNLNSAGEEAAYYAVSEVKEVFGGFSFVQGSVCYYVNTLHALFLLIGNHWIAGIWLQIILQYAGVLLTYFALRSLAGVFPAVWMTGCFMLTPTAVRESLTYSPEQLYFCIFGIGLLLLSIFLHKSQKEQTRLVTLILLGIFSGVYIGAAAYTDVLGVLLIFPVCMIVGLEREKKAVGKWIGLLVAVLLVALLSFFGLLFLDAFMSGTDFFRVMNAWALTYSPKFAGRISLLSESDSVWVMVLLLFCAAGVFSFWRRKSLERFSVWIISLITVMLFQVFGLVTENMDGSNLLLFYLGVLSGISLSELFYYEGTELLAEAVIEEEDLLGQEAVIETDDLLGQENVIETDDLLGQENVIETDDLLGQENVIETDDRLEQETVIETDNLLGQDVDVTEAENLLCQDIAIQEEPFVQKTNYIENPLPLPKRHEHRKMDYAFEPDISMMKYDIEVSDHDDFDL